MKREIASQMKELDHVDLSVLQPVGYYLTTLERAALQLAEEYAIEEDLDFVSVSWDCRVKAQEYVNSHSLGESLDEITRLRKKHDNG